MTDSSTTISDDKVAAWVGLVRVSQRMLGDVEADLKQAGFPPLAWYDALLELRRAGTTGLRPFELQDKMLLAQYNLSRLTDRVVNEGYAQRLPCEDDGRGHVLAITASGRGLLKRMWPAYRSAIDRHFAGRLSTDEAKRLAGILDRLR